LVERLRTALGLPLAILLALFSIFPVVWIVSAAFSASNTLINQSLIPAQFSFVNFRKLLTDPDHPFGLWMWNSIKISGITTIVVVTLTALAAYSFSRFDYRGRRGVLVALLVSQLFPNLLAIVALFLLLNQIGGLVPMFGLDSSGGLILIYASGALGFNMWLMKGYFDAIPKELDESATLDGASDLQVLWYIILPLVRPILVVVGLLTFIGTYSDFLLPRVMLNKPHGFTLALGLSNLISGAYTTAWGTFAAGALIGALPILVLFLFLQRQLVGGLSVGAIKF
jgi:arabinogalactan oligomer / maltooligosaccharide transport system permease protein